jgi:glycosyltransferase involved in cell wall biosynthesis
MQCPTLVDVAPPPDGKHGWPWTEAAEPLGLCPAKGGRWPRISIVTPSYNQGHFIEETIRSVLLQGYPNLEYFIIDGGSTDNSLEIIHQYAPWLTHWVSEADRGQTHAINKGLTRCSGEIFNWLNTDDFLTAGALESVGRTWVDESPDICIGEGLFLDGDTREVSDHWKAKAPRSAVDFISPVGHRISQPATFLAKRVVDSLGPFREDLHCVMDSEFYLRAYLRLGPARRFVTLDQVLAHVMLHPQSKTTKLAPQFAREWKMVLAQHSELFSAEERNLWSHYQRRSRLQDGITNAGSLLQLLRFSLTNPDVLLNRFYWGAVRRRLGHHA